MAISKENKLDKSKDFYKKERFTEKDTQELREVYEEGAYLLVIPIRKGITVSAIYDRGDGNYKDSTELSESLSNKLRELYARPSQSGSNLMWLRPLLENIQ